MKTGVESKGEQLSKWQIEINNCLMGSWKTLSGYETADGRNSWDTFKLLLSDAKHQQPETSDNCFSDTSDAVHLVVSVEDTGIGIPLDTQKHIFEPFVQANSSTSCQYGGTGISLSISRCLVELMSGEMDFVSQPGVGSTFTFSIVLRKSHTQTQQEMDQPLTGASTCLKGMRAIVLEGLSVQLLQCPIYIDLAFRFEIVNDRKSTLAALCRGMNGEIGHSGTGIADMIIIDDETWGPGTGLPFAQFLKELLEKRTLVITSYLPKMILLAISINSSISERAKAAGFAETVIVKPLRTSTMGACLQQALGVGNKLQQDNGNTSVPISPQSSLLGTKILVVDDNKVNLRVVFGALQKYVAIVECAEGGKGAMAILQPSHSFDACFMDVQMPEIDGYACQL